MPAHMQHPYIIGRRRDGSPIYLIAGGSGEGEGGGEGDAGGSGEGSGGDGGTGADGFKSAESKAAVLADLASERQKRKDAEARAARADELEKQLAEVEDAKKSDAEKAVEKARKEATAETEARVRAEVTRDRALDKLEVALTGKVVDLELATLALTPRLDEFIDKDGGIDTKAIGIAVEQLLETKPHLKADAKGGDWDGGARRTSSDDNVTPGSGRLRNAYAKTSK